jgi:hypothetical protein
MKFRFGRLRIPEVLMIPLGSGLVLVSLVGTWDSSGSGFGFLRLVTLLIGSVCLLAVVQAGFRTSPAGAIAADVFLCAVCPIALITLLISYATSDTVDGSDQRLAQIGILAAFVSAVWGLRSVSRVFDPDPSAQIETLAAPEKQAPCLGG